MYICLVQREFFCYLYCFMLHFIRNPSKILLKYSYISVPSIYSNVFSLERGLYPTAYSGR